NLLAPGRRLEQASHLGQLRHPVEVAPRKLLAENVFFRHLDAVGLGPLAAGLDLALERVDRLIVAVALAGEDDSHHVNAAGSALIKARATNARTNKTAIAGIAAIAHLIMKLTIDQKGIWMSVTTTSARFDSAGGAYAGGGG